ncbi:HPr kinase [Pandoraea iniqua]|uniref:Type 3 secretion system stator protein n=1 Tax=Pandoraea iniqua TaxID=2508288 RepID=A0A5E4YIM7_9BURK|nr:HrpE/YscL family type III secretion apparatus protein [Pandoraea iniqua]VVE48290.1 HPr kinase [Pandoraea iniqua]
MFFVIPVRDKPGCPDDAPPLRVGVASGVVPRETVQAYVQTQDILSAAHEEASRLAQAARFAYDEQRQRGYADGLELARQAQSERMVEVVSRTVDYFERIEQRMVTLVTDAVRRIVCEVPDDVRVLAVVRSVLSVVRNQKQITLRLNPRQVDTVQSHLNDLLIAYPGNGFIDLVADSRITMDACVLESEMGFVEASLEGQLRVLRNVFERVLGSNDETTSSAPHA